MTTFDNREKGSESKFAHDAEVQFQLRAKRNKIVGAWAAAKLGLSGKKAEEYALSVATEDNKVKGDSDVIGKLLTDFNNAEISITEADIKKQLIAAEAEAKKS